MAKDRLLRVVESLENRKSVAWKSSTRVFASISEDIPMRTIEQNITEGYKKIEIKFDETTFVSGLNELKKEIDKLHKVIGDFSKKVPARNILIQNLRNPSYILKQPLSVTLESEGTEISATCYDVNMYGCGDSEEEAIDDFCCVLVEYYESLREDREKLGAIPKKYWLFLSSIIEERK